MHLSATTTRVLARRWCLSAALLLLAAALLLPPLLDAVSLEFRNRATAVALGYAQPWALLLGLLLILANQLLATQSLLEGIIRCVFVGVLAAAVFFVEVVIALDGMCEWTTEQTLFINRNAATTVVALRSIGCGATDSGPPGHGTFQITSWPLGLQRVVRADTSQLDRGEWQRVGRSARAR